MMRQAMLPTHRAILRSNRLEGRGSGGQHLPTDRPVAVYVAVLGEPLGEVDARDQVLPDPNNSELNRIRYVMSSHTAT